MCELDLTEYDDDDKSGIYYISLRVVLREVFVPSIWSLVSSALSFFT